MTRATRILWLMHFVGNALLLWLAYYWLGVGESTIGRLVWSAVLAVVVLGAALWLHGSGLVFFRSDRIALSPALRTALRNLLPLFVLAIVALFVYGLLSWWRDYSTQPAFKIASYLTLKSRKPVKPATIQSIFNAILWLVRWAVIPVLLLPLAANVANKGWRGYGSEAWRLSRRWLYWIQVVTLLVAGIWLPLKLINWVPHFDSFSMQMASFLFRLLIAYLLFVTACLLLELVSSGVPVVVPSAPGRTPAPPGPRDSQPVHAAVHDEVSTQTPHGSVKP